MELSDLLLENIDQDDPPKVQAKGRNWARIICKLLLSGGGNKRESSTGR